MRWSNGKSTRFQALREQEARGELSPAERAELDALLADLDADEADPLGPATQRLRAEAEAMAKETESLEAKARELERIAEGAMSVTDEELERVRQGQDEAARGEGVDMRQTLQRLRMGG